MANIVLGILGPVMQIGQWIWTPVKRGMCYIIHCKNNLHSLGDAVQNLETMLNSHKQYVDIAKMSGDDIKPEVQIWLRDADNAMTDVAELRRKAEAGEKCFIGWCPDCKWRYSFGKKAWNLTTALNKLIEEAKFDTVSVEVRRAPEVQNLIFSEAFQSFEATRQAMDRVMKALKNDEVTTIGVYGMGGIGKTTLVKQVGAQVCKDGLFDLMIMAVFSQNPVVVQIQDQLKDMLALPLHETTKMARAARLRERIIRGQKILIVLDDIWETMDLSIIGIPNEDELGRCGSKVVFTTRIFHVCQTMGSQVKIPLNRLSEDDSWDLFVKNTNKSFESTNLYELAKEVAKECGGLPVALVAVARALKDKDQLEEWEEAARRLKISQPANLHDDGRVLKCIKLSYDYLKDEDAKSCFLLCCLFPEDSKIPIYDLIKYGLGKGLFRDATTFVEARSRAHTVINYLKSSNLLLDGETDNQVRMHDVIRDMAMLIAASEYGDGFLVKAGAGITVWPNNAYEGHSAISLMNNYIRKLPEELVCPKLQILLLQNNYSIQEIPVAFFEGLNEVKVLDISETGISILPGSLSLQTNLQALFLDGCRLLRDVSQLGELNKVEILSLRRSGLEELPEEIGNLGKLRMLDLTETKSIKRIPSNLISRLSRLEELYMIGSFCDWGGKVEGEGNKTNAGFEELLCLEYLSILNVEMIDAKCLPVNVRFNPKWAKFHIRIGRENKLFDSPHDLHKYNSRELILDRSINSLPRWFNTVVTQRSQTLTYSECDGLSDIMLEYDHGYLHRLEILVIEGCSQVVTLMDTTTERVLKPVFENLEVLIVQHSYNMKELLVGELPQGSLGKLKYLVVNNHHNLLNPLVPSNLLQSLQNLEKLSIANATSAENVFRSEDFGQEQIKLEKLRAFGFYDLPRLENILSGPAGYLIFRNLQTLELFSCGKDLKYVFPSEVFQSLSQLENLRVGSCKCLEMIIGPGEGTSAEKIVLAQLTRLGLTNLPQLTSIYTHGIECPSLQVLEVRECPQFPTSTYDFHSRNPVTIETYE